LGDVFKSIDHPTICLVSGILRNATGSTLAAGTPLLAQPVKFTGGKWVFVEAGDEANAGGLVFDQGVLAASLADATDVPYQPGGKTAILTLGPAIILETHLPANDVVGVALNWTTLQTRFGVIDPHIKFVDQPPSVYTQTFG